MFLEQRHQLILDLLAQHGSVRVKDLAALFQLTEDSIRKDLTSLESDGKLIRTYGGAVSLKQNELIARANARRLVAVDAKRKIAQAALRLCRTSLLIFLDTSSTCLALATLLPNEPFRILTNMLPVSTELSGKSRIVLYLAGGVLSGTCYAGNYSRLQ